MVNTEYKDGNVIVKSDCFDLRQTLDCGQAFRFYKDEDDFWHGVVGENNLLMKQNGDEITFYNISKQQFDDFYADYFTFNVDYAKIKKTLSLDKTLKKAVELSGGIRILHQDKFETICSFIFSQNNNIPRIKGIIERFCENFGEKKNGYFLFPTAEKIACLQVSDLDPIRAGFRAKYIIDAAQKTASGELCLEALETLELDEARKMLMSVKGIGPKVADCVLLFSCNRFDAFPVDVWIKKVMEKLYPGGLPDCTKGIEGIAQQYLFDYARTIKI